MKSALGDDARRRQLVQERQPYGPLVAEPAGCGVRGQQIGAPLPQEWIEHVGVGIGDTPGVSPLIDGAVAVGVAGESTRHFHESLPRPRVEQRVLLTGGRIGDTGGVEEVLVVKQLVCREDIGNGVALSAKGTQLPQVGHVVGLHSGDDLGKSLVEANQVASGRVAGPELVRHIGHIRWIATAEGGGIALVPTVPGMRHDLHLQLRMQGLKRLQQALPVARRLSVCGLPQTEDPVVPRRLSTPRAPERGRHEQCSCELPTPIHSALFPICSLARRCDARGPQSAHRLSRTQGV